MTNRRPHAQHHVYLPARDDSPGAFPRPPKPGSAEMITVRPSSRAAVCRPAAAGARSGQPGGDGGPPDHGKCGVVRHARSSVGGQTVVVGPHTDTHQPGRCFTHSNPTSFGAGDRPLHAHTLTHSQHTRTHTSTYAHAFTHAHAHIHTRTHARARAHTHPHTHPHARPRTVTQPPPNGNDLHTPVSYPLCVLT